MINFNFAYVTDTRLADDGINIANNKRELKKYLKMKNDTSTTGALEQRVPPAELSRCRAAASAAKLPLARHVHPRGAFCCKGNEVSYATRKNRHT